MHLCILFCLTQINLSQLPNKITKTPMMFQEDCQNPCNCFVFRSCCTVVSGTEDDFSICFLKQLLQGRIQDFGKGGV